jgi:uncharacterized protein YbjT (DUF2867 family)
MRALVIGGSGQVGGALVAELSARGHEVVATWRSVEQPGLIHCDLGDAAEVERVLLSGRRHLGRWLREGSRVGTGGQL